MTDDALQLTPALSGTTVAAAESARKEKSELITLAGSVKAVADRLDADDATEVLRKMKAFLNAVEAQREAAKKPITELGRKIDSLARELTAEVLKEYDRISVTVGTFEAQQRRKAEEARRMAEYEAAKLAAEAQRKAAEAKRAAPTAEAGDRAADAIVATAQAKIVETKQQAASITVTKAAGTAVKPEIKFEVTDLKALYASNPELVTLEPNGTAIRAIIRANPNIQLPGVRHWKEEKLTIRN